MPSISTLRLQQIADDLKEDGLYTSANSIYAITEQRDRLLVENTRLADALRWARWQLVFGNQE